MSIDVIGPRSLQIHSLRLRALSLILLIAALAGCGGGASSPPPSRMELSAAVITNGHVYPAAAGLVLVEYDGQGNELQRSTATADDGSFQFSIRLSGTRIEAISTVSTNRVEQVFSSQLGNLAADAELEVTPLTTWYDQLVANGVSSSTASGDIQDLIAASCPALSTALDRQYLFASFSLPAADHDWLLGAVAAYLQGARNLGEGPKVDFPGWSSVLDRHGDMLSQLCAFSAAVSTPAWSAAQASRLQQEANVQTPDTARLAEAVTGARAQGLSALARQIQQSEYPDQTVVLQAADNVSGRELTLASDFVMVQYQLPQSSGPAAQDFVDVPDTLGAAITSSGNVVATLEGSTTGTDATPAALRLTNHGAADKTLHLVIDGQNVADLPSVIGEIVAMPVAYSGEPLYRKAWRYLIAHKRDTQPLAISFFQFQPDLWLRSVGSSYCEAQSSVLYRIWRAMGYEARVHALTGHVTVEILIDGHWEVFDPYLRVYYTDRQGQIVGVAELEQDPTLITNPQTPLLPLTDIAYSSTVANIFGTADDNYIGTDYMSTEPEPLDNTVQIPAGGYLEVNSATDVVLDSSVAGTQTDMSTMSLWVPPGYTGTLRLPLLLLDVKGAGSVQLFGRALDASGNVSQTTGLAALGSLDTSATDPDLHARLQWFYFNDPSEIGVTEIKINSSGADGLLLTLMTNPLYFATQQQLTVRVDAADVDGLSFAGTPVTE